MSDFREKRREIEKLFEDALIKASLITTPEGFRIEAKYQPVISVVNDYIDEIEKAYTGGVITWNFPDTDINNET